MRHGTITENKYRKRGEKKALCSWQGEGVPQELLQGQKFTVVSISPFRNQWERGGSRQNRGRQPALNSLRPGRPRRGAAGAPRLGTHRREQAEPEKALSSPSLRAT